MDERTEVEAFDRGLDDVLEGRPATRAVSDELSRDLEFAARLSRLDWSGESRIRAGLRAKLVEPPQLGRLLRLIRQPWAPRRVTLAFAGLAATLVVVGFFRYRSQERIFAPPQSVPPEPPLTAGKDALGVTRAPTLGRRDSRNQLLNANALQGKVQYAEGASFVAGDAFGSSPESESMAFGGLGGDTEAPRPHDTEAYRPIDENAFRRVLDHPLSTFSIDVDAASYANVRRFLGEGRMPPKDAVRIEELVNYFRYDYPEPEGEHPISITAHVAECPWAPSHRLVRIGLKARSIPSARLPPANLVFLIDSSGSMESPDKLPLLKGAFRLLVEQLREADRVSIVAYAGSAGLVLPPTSGAEKAAILAALERLQAGGSTAGGEGLRLAYDLARKNRLKGGNNRVILATDGDFNIGVTSEGELVRLIEQERGHGVFLTVLGFGRGNLQDSKMEALADRGNGHYAYIDDILEARKVFVQELGATLLTVAKDVKVQIEFNPSRVQTYRLIGYENRLLESEDFNDDSKDAGELGAGHSATALYEVIPAGVPADLPSVEELKYQRPPVPTRDAASGDWLTVKFRYKSPDGYKSRLVTQVLRGEPLEWSKAPESLRFAASAAGFGMLLRGSAHKGDLDYGKLEHLARDAVGEDEGGYRAEFLRLVEKARLLDVPDPEREQTP